MPQLIIIEGHEGQRRQLAERLALLEKDGSILVGKFEAGTTFSSWRALFENAISPGLFETGRQVIVAEGCDALGAFPDALADCLEDDKSASVIIAMFNSTGVTSGYLKSKSKAKSTKQDNQDNSSNNGESGESGSEKSNSRVFSKEVLALNKIVILKSEGDVPPWKRRDWLTNLAREQGWRISRNAAQLLADSIESLEELRGELNKLAIYASGREITERDVQVLSFDEGPRALLVFLDGVCQCDVQAVARALVHLKREPMLPTLTAIVNRLRPALMLLSFASTGPSPESGSKLAQDVLAAIDVKDVNSYAVTRARDALSHYGAEAIKAFIMGALQLSYRTKTSLSEGWPGFELLLWKFMGRTRRSGSRPSHSPRQPQRPRQA